MKTRTISNRRGFLLRDAWVAVGASSLIAARIWMGSDSINPWPVIFGGAITFIYYSTLHASFSNSPKRSFVIGQILLVAVSIPVIFEIQLPGLDDPAVRTRLVLFIASIVAGALYMSPIGMKGTIFALRQVPFLKAPLIAFCWTMLTCFLPVFFGEPVASISYIFSRWLMMFGAAMLSDLIDCHDDQGRIVTIPTTIGITGTRWLAILFFFLSDLVFAGWTFDHFHLLILPYALLPALLIDPPANTARSLGVDSIMVVYFPLFYFFW